MAMARGLLRRRLTGWRASELVCASPPLVAYGDSRPRAPSLALRSIHLVPQGETKSDALSLACPLGKVPSEARRKGDVRRNLYIALQRKIFPRIAYRVVCLMLNMKKRFADGNFVWNQDEVPQNSRYAKRFCYSSQLIAQTVATLLWFQTLIP